MVLPPDARPNMFVVVPDAIARQEALAALARDLVGKGYFCAAAIDNDDKVLPLVAEVALPSEAAAWIFATHGLREHDDILAARNASVLIKFARLLRRHGVSAHILSDRIWSTRAGWHLGDRFRAEADRNLELRPDERYVADLTSNAVRSTIWLIDRKGELLIRKSFSRHFPSYLANELAARRRFGDTRIVEICEAEDNVLYMPFVDGCKAWDQRLFSFCRRDHARAVREFLAYINREGYSMVDINPSAFLFDGRGDLKVVDFEFFLATRPAADFGSSCDHSGQFSVPGLPKKNGWVRYWYDAVGGPWDKIERMSIARYRTRLLVHLLCYRLPVRVAHTLEQAVKAAFNQGRRVIGLDMLGQFRT